MDKEFIFNSDGLHQTVKLMGRDFSNAEGLALPIQPPHVGMGSTGGSAPLDCKSGSYLGPEIPERAHRRKWFNGRSAIADRLEQICLGHHRRGDQNRCHRPI